ncbi:MAG: PAS domain S-box protein, partial [bacterium]|nr:PAS domain S-box protein [bacterium]
VNEDDLIPTNFWYMEKPKQFDAFKIISEIQHYKIGEGLPGSVLASGKAAWVTDVNNNIDLTRSKEASLVGIKSGIAFPVLIRNEIVAILEFFSTSPIDPSESLLVVMSNVGTQLGRVIERIKSEEERIKLIREQAARAEIELAKQKIQLSEIRYRTMIEQSPQSIQIISPDGHTVQVNKAWEALWGVKLHQIEGYNILKDKQLIELGIMPHIQQGFDGIATVIPAVEYHPDKTIKGISNVTSKWTSAFIYPVKDEEGRIQEIVLIHEDISLQKNSEKNLKQSEERFRTLIEQSTDAIQLVSPEGTILYTSESIKKVLGYTVEELQGSGVAPFLHPDDLKYFNQKLQELIKNPSSQITLQYRVKHKDGSWAWLETTGVNHLETPNINALVGTFRNITERKKYEEELKYQKTLLEAQREVSPEGVLVVSRDGKMVSYNNRFVQMWKFSVDLMASGEDEAALIQATEGLEDPTTFLKRVREVYKNRATDISELRFKDGRVFDRYGAPIIGEDGMDYGYVWYFQDVTERKRLENQKDEFISIASHELKTPVTSIKSFGQVLQVRFQREGNQKAVELLGKMDTQIDKLTNLIEDLLDVTKIETGRVLYSNIKFSFDDLVQELVEELQRTTNNHPIIIESITNQVIFADRDRVGQVITNLISNAIKYSPQPNKIIIRSSVFDGQIKLSVQDFGIGIPTDKINKVFERFFRISGPGKETFPGLGLGLYISSEIIKQQGGRIWAESTEGSGSVFCFTLPIKTIHKKPKEITKKL